ncbi:MAG: TRAP transporter large permease subunit, partial [Pseudomonadota bacterium]
SPVMATIMIFFMALVVEIFISSGSAKAFLLMPIMLPLAQEIGMHEIHFCIFMVTSLGVGFITPPLGLNLFVLSGLTGQSVLGIARSAIPYVLSMLVVVLLIAFIPEVSLLAVPERLR